MPATTQDSGGEAVQIWCHNTNDLLARSTALQWRRSWVLLACILTAVPLRAEVLGDIRVSRVDSKATLEIEFACALRYIEHQRSTAGAELRIKLATGMDCRLPLRDISGDLRRPSGARLANVSEIEFLHDDKEFGTLLVRFSGPNQPRVRQSANEYLIFVDVDIDNSAGPLELAVEDPVVVDAPTPGVAPQRDVTPTRRSDVSVNTTQNSFVLRVTDASPEQVLQHASLASFHDKILYANQIIVGERQWRELKLGFFDNEEDARDALETVSEGFPDAWITVAGPAEQLSARQSQIDWPATNVSDDGPGSPATLATTPEVKDIATMTEEQVTGLLADARSSIVSQDYSNSIAIYTDLLAEPGIAHRREAREFLGVAYLRSGDATQAAAEFSAFLDEYPDAPESRRVQQRLAALSVTERQGSVPPIGSSPASTINADATARLVEDEDVGHWEFFGSAAQYYLRGVNLAEGSFDDFVAQSAMLSQAHLAARRRGERFDLSARANLGYLYDFEASDAGEQLLVSYAYLDVDDTRTDVGLRIGRQQQLTSGVLSRFDGLHASYQYRPDITVNVTAGLPVDASRYRVSGDRYTYGASVDFNNLLGDWDLSVYANRQTVDGILDRQAVGAEALYQGSDVTLVALLDYDASFNIINTALVNGTWRLHDRLTLHGRARSGVYPYLTTRNALIGQTTNTIREMLETYTEGQIRRLARHRTVDERFASAGFSAALTPRLQARFDASFLEYSATVASGGVAAFPDTGPQYTYGGHIQGSGYLKPGQIAQLGYRHLETRRFDTDTVWLDLRYPFGQKLRVQARLSFANRIANQDPAGDIDNWIASPLVRLVYSGNQRMRFEFEAGGRWLTREYPLLLRPPQTNDGELEQRDYYVQLGYILDF